MNRLIIIVFFLSFFYFANAQNDTLPFAIAKEKRLPEEELANKKEGLYITGVPDISYDPVNGFGYGGEGTLFLNGKKSNPFFAYTPYRASFDLVVFNTSNSQREIKLSCDVPYIFNTKWRLRVEAAAEVNPNKLYFGITEKSLSGLSYYPNGDSSQGVVNNATYKDYTNHLTGLNTRYNTYKKKEALLNISMERSFFDGKLRGLIGYEYAVVGFMPFAGNSLLRQDSAKKSIIGVGKNKVAFLQAGFIYDTRNLEADPTQGIFAEALNELSLKALGSQYNFNKTFIHVNYYTSLFPKTFKRLVFAGRVAAGYTAGAAPFYEYQDQWSSEGSIEGLGGGSTLRGYKQDRFQARLVQFNNIELRYKFAQITLLKQYLAFSGVPFWDTGAVWDNFNTVKGMKNYRSSEGLGLRIAWNLNTILRFDYAISKEDKQFFFQIGHCF